MKIKKLTIRNIAAVEAGYIDFEMGLRDPETGEDASLFLITGDTGSGKTVILDCISMALYGTTPRVRSVASPTKNKYTGSGGEEISVNDITQYTRIGISAKDDCYSELTFIGNDGVEYVSRFTLGRTTHKNYAKPKWTLRIGNDEFLGKSSDVKERIRQAVGLSFEQFSRMAMLAQGQFEIFLTGKKEERESILEQLTNTEKFSRYGKAITEIYKEAKNSKGKIETRVKDASVHLLSEEEKARMVQEREEKRAKLSEVNREKEKLYLRLSKTEALLRVSEKLDELKIERREINRKLESEEYGYARNRVKLWDETTVERESLAEKRKLEAQIEKDWKGMEECGEKYLHLSLSLKGQEGELAEKKKRKADLKSDLERCQPFKALYADCSLIESNITGFGEKSKTIKTSEATLGQYRKEAESVNVEIETSRRDVKMKEEEVAECGRKIDQTIRELQAMNPTELRTRERELSARIRDLRSLAEKLNSFEKEREETLAITTKVKKLSEEVAAKQQLFDRTEKELKRLEVEKAKTEERYMTMELSVQENFRALRLRLAEEHVANCPLCGQGISDSLHEEWSSDSYFASLLSPLKEERDEAAAVYDRALKLRNESKAGLDDSKVILTAEEKHLGQLRLREGKAEEEINRLLGNLGLEAGELLADSVETEMKRAQKALEEVTSKQQSADKLQTQINSLTGERGKLETKSKMAREALQKLESMKTGLEEKRRSTQTRIGELRREREEIRGKVDAALRGWTEDWEGKPEATVLRLKSEATLFDKNSKDFDRLSAEIKSLGDAIESITKTKYLLYGFFRDREAKAESSTEAAKSIIPIEELRTSWIGLHREVMALTERLGTNRSRLKELDSHLGGYYLSSGISKTDLSELMDLGSKIPEARKVRDEVESEDKVNLRVTTARRTEKENLMKELELTEDPTPEDLRAMNATFRKMEEESSRISQEFGELKSKLENDVKLKAETAALIAELEKAGKREATWEKMNRYFGGTRFRTLVQSHILRPLLNNANLYLRRITDHYTLTCSDENEQLSILVLDRYNKNEPRSVTVLSGGERFMVSLALSLALSAMNRPDMNVDILFIDEGFGTLDAKSLETVMETLRRLPEINGQSGRRVGVISHREELAERIDCQIRLRRSGEGRSRVEIS